MSYEGDRCVNSGVKCVCRATNLLCRLVALWYDAVEVALLNVTHTHHRHLACGTHEAMRLLVVGWVRVGEAEDDVVRFRELCVGARR